MDSSAEGDIDSCVRAYEELRHRIRVFGQTVASFFSDHPELTAEPAIVHSVKWRMKDPEHLRQKLLRKRRRAPISRSNFFQRITDLAGVRVFHLHQEQSAKIHTEIMSQAAQGDWFLAEKPQALSWDPEARKFFRRLGLATTIRPTYYTSIHYLVRPHKDSPLCCEIQVRTLFEEIWGEIDHMLNYPTRTQSVACAEQLRALSKLVGTGGRLVDSILRSHGEHERLKNGQHGTRQSRSRPSPAADSSPEASRQVTDSSESAPRPRGIKAKHG